MREGEGETSGISKARPQLSEQGFLVISDLGSVAKPTRIANPQLTKKETLEIPEGYWHIFDQMEN